jgi:hypothetical protein
MMKVKLRWLMAVPSSGVLNYDTSTHTGTSSYKPGFTKGKKNQSPSSAAETNLATWEQSAWILDAPHVVTGSQIGITSVLMYIYIFISVGLLIHASVPQSSFISVVTNCFNA